MSASCNTPRTREFAIEENAMSPTSGTAPVSIPIEQPAIIDFAINLKTAATLGLTVPPSLLLAPDKGIEYIGHRPRPAIHPGKIWDIRDCPNSPKTIRS
jgi:hypothetical protein